MIFSSNWDFVRKIFFGKIFWSKNFFMTNWDFDRKMIFSKNLDFVRKIFSGQTEISIEKWFSAQTEILSEKFFGKIFFSINFLRSKWDFDQKIIFSSNWDFFRKIFFGKFFVDKKFHDPKYGTLFWFKKILVIQNKVPYFGSWSKMRYLILDHDPKEVPYFSSRVDLGPNRLERAAPALT